jgi:alkylation response protein AidB-like acyl-CoA dehydrogenase
MLQRPLFTAEHDLFREQVRRFIEREVVPHHARWEAEGIVPRSVWRAAGEGGGTRPASPKE